MIQEAYCSFEVAKLLKEKGFDELCNKKYNGNKNIVSAGKMIELWQNSEFDNDEECSAPTHQMVMRWLREVHHYYIQVMLDSWALGSHSGYYIVIQRTDNDFEMMLQDAVDEVFYQTYEEAVEAALKYALEVLI